MNTNTIRIAAALAALALTLDGGLALAQAAGPGHGKQTFVTENDGNGDGRVTAEEFAAARARKYATFDLDGDGKVNEADYVGEFSARFGKAGKTPASVPAGQLKQAHVRFGVLDTDTDGSLTLAEFHASGERMFERLDSNGDGVVDAADTARSF